MPHGVMFHHFHDSKHPVIQGSLSAALFERCIDCVANAGNLLRADEWYQRAVNGSLEAQDICLTFDDTLRSQIDIALPIMQRRRLTAFWFVYSSVLEGIPETLEIYRYFRNTEFDSVDEFYEAFERALIASRWGELYQDKIRYYSAEKYLSAATYYSNSDRWFRYVRDEILGPPAYYEIMDQMLLDAKYDCNVAMSSIWMNDDDIVSLDKEGHFIGLHSYTHPTAVAKLSIEAQKVEYTKNAEHLSRVLKKPVLTAAHPNGSYSVETLDILRRIGVKIGFRADMAEVPQRSALEYPREDHAYIVRRHNLSA